MDLLSSAPPPPLRKEIETINVYKRVNDSCITSIQRTATFYSKADARYINAFEKDPRVESTAIDVRSYEVTYIKI